MNPTDRFESPIILGLGDKGPVAAITTPSEVSRWIEGEWEFYVSIASPLSGTTMQQDLALMQAWKNLAELFALPRSTMTEFMTRPHASEHLYKGLVSEFSEHYKFDRLIYSECPAAHYAKQVAVSDPMQAMRILFALSDLTFAIQNTKFASQWLRAGAIAEGLRRGWVDQRPALDASLTIFRRDWDERFADALLQQTVLNTRGTDSINTLEEDRAEWVKRIADFNDASAETLKKQADETAVSINTSVEQIEAFKSTYNQALALRAPTEYWTDKRRAHRNMAGAWLALFSIAAGLSVWAVWFVWHRTVENHSVEPSYTAYIPCIGAAFLAAWFLRIFSRQVVTNLALNADASERVAMVKTYLALTEGGHALESDRTMILSSLFRTASKIEDDATPPTIADAFAKALK